MYAVVVIANVDNPDDPEGLRQLQERVAPGVSQMPGFKAGYWLRPTGNNEGLSVVIVDSEENARAGLENAKNMFNSGQVPQGVTLKSADVREVVASA